MKKFSLDTSTTDDLPETPAYRVLPPAQRGSGCDLYAPGHQMHYTHQGDAVRSPSQVVQDVLQDGSEVILLLEDDSELRWRHHDPDRLRRMLELLIGKSVVYPDFHALRVGPYWFNCAREGDAWQDCRVDVARRPD